MSPECIDGWEVDEPPSNTKLFACDNFLALTTHKKNWSSIVLYIKLLQNNFIKMNSYGKAKKIFITS